MVSQKRGETARERGESGWEGCEADLSSAQLAKSCVTVIVTECVHEALGA